MHLVVLCVAVSVLLLCVFSFSGVGELYLSQKSDERCHKDVVFFL